MPSARRQSTDDQPAAYLTGSSFPLMLVKELPCGAQLVSEMLASLCSTPTHR